MGDGTQITEMAETQERLINGMEVARRYAIHPKTVLKLVKRKAIPAPVLPLTPGGHPKWRERDINQHIRSMGTENAA